MNRQAARLLAILGPFLGLILIYAFFALHDLAADGSIDQLGTLFSRYNLKTVAAQTSIVAIAALGMTLVIISGGIDLSAGSSIALTTVVVAVTLRGLSGSDGVGALEPALAALAGITAGGIVGLLNGCMITGLRIVPFIATLGMMGIARGVAKLLANEQKVNAPPSWLDGLLAVDPSPTTPLWKLPGGVVVLLALALVVFVILRYSVFGRYIFAIGSNESAARLCGIRVRLQKVLIYTVSGLLTGVAGVMQFGQLTVGDPTVSVGKELDIIASVVIGGGSLNGGKGGVAGTILGAFIMGILRNGCDIYGIPNYIQEIFIGLIIVAAVAVDQLRSRSR
jgi:ribose/xylose/arabinose/galactoside ABC-type transport system permease subunit